MQTVPENAYTGQRCISETSRRNRRFGVAKIDPLFNKKTLPFLADMGGYVALLPKSARRFMILA
ncbi:hypothetical protein [Aporhodopirellula aestuarii]|uniref:hypothetical protein n=1 Tax=Aporhodopirellula aestuarii TaxID=2950107 RepID=UPI0020338B27|nr:hypothetical protein [Aporhodopirellula aestuarii]